MQYTIGTVSISSIAQKLRERVAMIVSPSIAVAGDAPAAPSQHPNTKKSRIEDASGTSSFGI
jgi:hypothetical protein